ncbi:MAG: (2E,6E)-farnesyl diphosphate synthase [Gammaproteobacteria bacterium]|nr:MAG: (2E,6E)-farnesyl diphosphate synthase [Gammaproteobacteria bacterium]RKZ95775.1 MAG: (2E,6E)-farnesyl diphosphate synthase [Gammaproteobacteria bacterium]RLA00247.1 MAG: (2E,6E)-farnesyl diphosphate synthase [Gammaproteobacteria bacterium]
MEQRQTRIENALSKRLPDTSNNSAKTSTQLITAMRYSILDGGKRLRALLVYATGEALGSDLDKLDVPASAVEMIHAYSLVHDDMPIMDNDDLRRGRPTCHKRFDDATALLVGDALQSLAFETLCDDALSPIQQTQMVKTLARQSGVLGMAGGQAIDLESVGETLNINDLQSMHELKTGALIRASVRLGVLSSTQTDENILAKLDIYAFCIGLAFQVQDDVLDVIADTNTLGKTQGADIALNKPTYPALLGLDAAQEKASGLIDNALAELDSLPYNTEILEALAHFVVDRSH